MMVVFEPRSAVTLDELDDELVRAFGCLREAVSSDHTVVVLLDEMDVQGAGGVASAALAHGLLGLVRAFAVEGVKEGWRVSAVSFPATIERSERVRWAEQLADSAAVTGVLLRLGSDHLGKVPT